MDAGRYINEILVMSWFRGYDSGFQYNFGIISVTLEKEEYLLKISWQHISELIQLVLCMWYPKNTSLLFTSAVGGMLQKLAGSHLIL